MKKLNSKEIKKFTKKYSNYINEDIKEISMLKYYLTKEYKVNNNCLIVVKPFKTIINHY